jgi:hypothetical protein
MTQLVAITPAGLALAPQSSSVPVASTRSALAGFSSALGVAFLKESGREGVFVWESSNLSTQVSADPAQAVYIAPSLKPNGSAGAWVREFSGAVSLLWCGAVADGNTNNNAAFASAIALVQMLGGGDLLVPPGVFCATAVSIPSGPAVRIVGEGEQSVIETTSPTANLLSVSAWYSSVEHVKFTSSVTRTGGSFVQLIGAYSYAQDCHFDGDFIGIYMSGVGCKALRNKFSNGAPGAKRIWASGGDTSQTIENNLMASQSAGVAAGVFVDNSSALKVIANDIIGQGRCLHIAPQTGQSVYSLKSLGNFYDTATYGVAVEPSGSGVVRRLTCTDDWMGSHTSDGVLVNPSGTAVVDGADFLNCSVNGNVDGFALNGGSLTTNIRIWTSRSRNNSNAAVSVGSSVTKFIIDRLQCQASDGFTANAYGVFLGAGVDNYEIRNCDFTGQTTGSVVGHTQTATAVAYGNKGFVTESWGTATIPSGSTNVVVNHGLETTPNRVFISAQNDYTYRVWADTFGSTGFNINVTATVGYPLTFSWRAEV